MFSVQVRICRDGCCSGFNTTCTVQKRGFCQDIAAKYIGRHPHTHWGICILQPVLAPIRAGNQTLEVHLVEAESTRDTISKVLDGTNLEPMEYRVPNVNGMVK